VLYKLSAGLPGRLLRPDPSGGGVGRRAFSADESFYTPVYHFLRANKAPVRAFAALDFMHGLASWNFQQASKAADLLMPDAELGEAWVPKDMFRDGTVVAKLETNDVAGARHAFDTLSPLTGSRTDLRSRILDAHIRDAERRR
jgi:hypothetical protein